MSTATLSARVDAALQALPDGPVAVALSGGTDSSALLHALAGSDSARRRGLRAIHVDHQLHADSATWAGYAVDFTSRLDLPCTVIDVVVDDKDSSGPEAAARAARYAAIGAAITDGEIVALGHHRDDQVETLLLKLLRGAGTNGLGAMRGWRAFGRGWLWRPWLDLPRDRIAAYAREHGIVAIDDPSNENERFDRNYLRHRVMPLLRERWPEADAVIARSAAWQRDVAEHIASDIARSAATLVGLDPATLRIDHWLALAGPLRDGVLRQWLRGIDLPEPTVAQATELTRQLATAVADSNPCIRWPGAELRRYRDLLHAMRPLVPLTPGWQAAFDGSPLRLPSGLGSVEWEGDDVGNGWIVRFRQGGETLPVAGGTFHRDLRKWFQEHGIPPWQRDRMPLLCNGADEVLAVGDLWIADCIATGTMTGTLRWRRPSS